MTSSEVEQQISTGNTTSLWDEPYGTMFCEALRQPFKDLFDG